MSISTSLLDHVWIEAILHRIRSGSPNTTARRIPTDDERISPHRNKLTGQRRPEKGTAELLLDDNLALLRPANPISRRIIPELVADIETGQRAGALVFVPVAAGLRIRIHDSREDDGDPVTAATGYECVGGYEGFVESVGGVEGTSRGQIGIADVDDEEGGVGAEGETAAV